ncbi:MAG TPA: hypothetical protein VGM84_10330 [Steroidobacteraceae bacterium]|jgi:YD repeat-containing protein
MPRCHIAILAYATYEPFGAVSGCTWRNGTAAVRTYDGDGNVSTISSAGAKTYTYDDASRIVGIADGANSALSWGYGYDSLDRLNSAATTTTSQSFTYDANGNRLTQGGGCDLHVYRGCREQSPDWRLGSKRPIKPYCPACLLG